MDSSGLAKAVNALDEEAFQALYGRWAPMEPTEVADLFGLLFGAVVDRRRPGSPGRRPAPPS